MAFFDSMKVNLFSEMQGVITLSGKPVTGARITRTAIPDNDKKYSDSTISDSEGRFHFDKMETHMFMKVLPGQSSVAQKVIIEHEGKQYIAWEAAAAGDNDKGELNEMDVIGTDKEIAIDLKCDLMSEKTDKAGAYTTVISGICSWDGQKRLD